LLATSCLALACTPNLSGGNNGGLTNGGVLFHDSSAIISGSLQNPVTQTLVPNTTTQDAATIAQNVSNFASSLAATQTFTTINNTTTITGNGGLNVIDVANIQNAKLTLSGTANDFFVFNVSNAISTNQPMTLSGVSPSQILFNLTGTGTVFQTSGGDVSFGTYLATNGGRFQFSNLNLTGRLINIAETCNLSPAHPYPRCRNLECSVSLVSERSFSSVRRRDRNAATSGRGAVNRATATLKTASVSS
jgi:hypothetical protein